MTAPLHHVSPPATTPRITRPYLAIVKKLRLDDFKVPDKKGRHAPPKPAGTVVSAIADVNIYEPGRNTAFMSMAGAMRRKGMEQATIEQALQAENLARCKPPLEPGEVSNIVASVMRYPPSTTEEMAKSLNDTGNAARFGRRFVGKIVFVPGLGWLLWDGLQWLRDAVSRVMERAKEVARDIYIEGATVSDDTLRIAIASHAKASHQAPKLKAMLELSQSLPELVVSADQLDTNDMMLGVANGVLDLRTGKLQAADPERLITRHSTVEFDSKAKCPQFLAFIDQITGGDKSLARYLQRVVGYSLSGDTSEQCLFFLYGSGANGKTTFLNVLKDLLGPALASQTPTETLMARRTGATNDLARLQSVRVVIANEVEDGSLLAEALVKQITGGESLAAKFHYHEYFEFLPKFKLFIAGNHKPVIRGRDNGIWRRFRLVPFLVNIPKAQQDRGLQTKLRCELPGILNWALRGCRDWQKNGLNEPAVITAAVESYRKEMDVIGQWLADCCEIDPAVECKASSAQSSYKFWAEHNGYKPMASGTFYRDLGDRFQKSKRKDSNYYIGVKVKMAMSQIL